MRNPVLERFRLDGRVAVVTGGRSTLGRAIGSAFSEAGVAMSMRSSAKMRGATANATPDSYPAAPAEAGCVSTYEPRIVPTVRFPIRCGTETAPLRSTGQPCFGIDWAAATASCSWAKVRVHEIDVCPPTDPFPLAA